MRKTDVRAEELSSQPRVTAEVFERWRAKALFAYSLGVRACFAKVLVDFAFVAVLRRVSFELWIQRALGFSLDLAWIAAMVACWVLTRRARAYARGVGIDLSRAPEPPSDESAASNPDR